METIDYKGTVFYALKGLPGYYGSADGQVLSVKYHKPRLLSKIQYGGKLYYRLKLTPKKLNSVSMARIAYMVQNGAEYADLAGKYYTLQADGVAVCISLPELCRANARKTNGSRHRNPRKWIAEAKRIIGMMERYLDTGDISELAVEVERSKAAAVRKLIYAMRVTKHTAEEIVDEAVSETVCGIAQGLVVYNVEEYVSAVAIRMAKGAIRNRKRLLGLTCDPADREYYEF